MLTDVWLNLTSQKKHIVWQSLGFELWMIQNCQEVHCVFKAIISIHRVDLIFGKVEFHSQF